MINDEIVAAYNCDNYYKGCDCAKCEARSRLGATYCFDVIGAWLNDYKKMETK